MKSKSKVIGISFIVVYAILFIITLYYRNTYSISEKDLNEFIKKENMTHVFIHKISDQEYYLFNLPYIYVFHGPEGSRKSGATERNGIFTGGLQQGSIGLVIQNKTVLENAKTYSVFIDRIGREYEYDGSKYLVIKDSRIWNPNPEIKIVFSDYKGDTLYETGFESS